MSQLLAPLPTPAFNTAATARQSQKQMLQAALDIIEEQRQRIAELESETQTDPMTGLLNKRGFQNALAREMERARRSNDGKERAMLVLFDLDGLKAINDRNGHLAGDLYISHFAEQLKRHVRTTDYVARLGGDEFALILTDMETAPAFTILARLVRRLDEIKAAWRGRYFPLRASHGAVMIKAGMSAEELIESADQKLYACKAQRKLRQRAATNIEQADRKIHA